MEKTLSPEERIRKAEDLYYRRKMQNISRQTARVSIDKRNGGILRKITIQTMICAIIYLVFYAVQANNEILSKDIANKVNQLLEYDINFAELYSKVDIKEENEQNIENEETVQTVAPIEETLSEAEIIAEPEIANTIIEEASSINQMQEDANYIKENYSIVKPLTGTITSRFGVRESSNPNVAGYHTGLDVAQNEGTVIVSAISGTVELVSSVGNYRKSF